MKFEKLLILALSAASLFCVFGESLENAVDKVEKMIERTYKPGSRVRRSVERVLDTIVESQKTNDDEKIDALHKRFPDAFKENLIVRMPVIWKIHSLSLGYDIHDSAEVKTETVDIIKEMRQKDASSQISEGSRSVKETSAGIGAKAGVEGAFSWNPLKWVLQAKTSISGHFEANYSGRQETSSLWNE